jgi:hypothetical protein
MEKEEILQLAYIKVAQAAQLLQKAGEELLAEEAEELAKKVDLAVSMHAPSLPLSGFGPRPFRTAHLGISWVQPPRQLLAFVSRRRTWNFARSENGPVREIPALIRRRQAPARAPRVG